MYQVYDITGVEGYGLGREAGAQMESTLACMITVRGWPWVRLPLCAEFTPV